MSILVKIRRPVYWFLSLAVGLASLRFLGLGMETAFPAMPHQGVDTNRLFQLHVIASPIALILAPFQMSAKLRAKSIARHRLIGRAYVFAVLVGGVTGFFIGLNAMHGPFARAGFSLLSLVWLFTTFMAIYHIRAKRITLHKQWMIRSMALTFAGVTLRLLLPVPFIFDFDFGLGYAISAWLCWVPNLLIAEWFIRKYA